MARQHAALPLRFTGAVSGETLWLRIAGCCKPPIMCPPFWMEEVHSILTLKHHETGLVMHVPEGRLLGSFEAAFLLFVGDRCRS